MYVIGFEIDANRNMPSRRIAFWALSSREMRRDGLAVPPNEDRTAGHGALTRPTIEQVVSGLQLRCIEVHCIGGRLRQMRHDVNSLVEAVIVRSDGRDHKQ